MFANRRDKNSKALLQDLRDAGFSVLDLSRVGGGCPDALCSRNDLMLLVEVKSRESAYGRQGLSKKQLKWNAAWKGPKAVAVYELADVLKEFDRLMMWRLRAHG